MDVCSTVGQNIRFSLVMPVYNPPVGRFVACLDSILAQTYRNVELICINDGGDAEYGRIAKEVFAKSDIDFVYIEQVRKGVSFARNAGTQEARGDYVIYVDSDDEIPFYMVSRAFDILSENMVDVCLGYVQYVSPIRPKEQIRNGGVVLYLKNDVRKLFNYHLSGVAVGVECSLPNGSSLKIGPVARCVRASIAKSISFPEGIDISEDTLWNMSLFSIASSAAVCGDIWYWYWQTNDSASRGYKKDAYERAELFLAALPSFVPSLSPPVEKHLVLGRILGELNRVIKVSYIHKECDLPYLQKMANLKSLLGMPALSEYVRFSVARSGGFETTVKYLLLKTGLAIPVWRMVFALGRTPWLPEKS